MAPSQPRTITAVAKVVVAASRQALSPGDSVPASAQAFDAQGMVLPTATITWSSSAPSVATVDARGMVRAVAVGTAQIRATAEGETGTLDVSVSVTELCACTRIIDSTAVELVQRNDSSGVFVFRLVRGQAPAIDSATIIVGAENGGFLRRVNGVRRSGNVITLQTTPAYLEEAIRDGAFAATSFSEGESVPIEEGATRWGPWSVAYLAPNVQLAGARCCSLDDISLTFLEIDGPKKSSISGEVSIKKGNITFEPRLEIAGEFSGFQVQRFRTLLGGGVDLNIEEYEIKATIEVETGEKLWTSVPKKKRRMARLVKPFTFFIGPVPVVGIINKEVSLEVTVGGSVSAVFGGKFRTGFGLSAGAEWVRNRGWRPVTGSTSYLEAPAPEFKGVEGEVAVKIALVPEYSILFYGVGGPFINLEPYAEGKATAALSFEGGAASGLEWELKAEAGLNVNIGAKLSVFGFVDLLEAKFEIPIIRPFTLARAFSDGPLTARTSVTGPDQPDLIKIRLRPSFEDIWTLGPLGIITRNGPPPFGRSLATSSQDASVVPNDSVTFQDVRSGTSFMHRVALRDLAGNCAATDSTSYGVGVRSGSFLALSRHAPSSATFTINCIPLGALRARTVATGQDVVARTLLTLTRIDTIGSGKGSPPLAIEIPGGAAPPDTIIGQMAPANPALGTSGSYRASLDPGRRNCAVAKPATHSTIITSGDTSFTEFRLTCVPLGHVSLQTKTVDPDSASPSEPVTYMPSVTARDTADRVTAQPGSIGATSSRIMSGLIPVYNASGASGRHTASLRGIPNRCSHTGQAANAVTVFPGDTAIAPFALRCAERLHVRTQSTGIGSDGDGYVVVVENADGSADSVAIAVSDTIGIAGVTPGAHRISLADVDPNCNAPSSVTRNVSGRDSTLVSFTVHCPGPPAPTGLRATQIFARQIDLAWDPPPPNRRVGHYRLYRTTGNPATTVVIDSISTLTYSDGGLTPYTLYSYQVAAVDVDGVVGPRSGILRVRTLDETPPSTPANLTATAVSAFRINLTWSAASDAQTGISRYRVYRNGSLIDSTAGTAYASAGLTPATTYSYYVVAVNGQGQAGSQSNSASATTFDGSAPSAPSGLSATPISMSRIDLAWLAASDPQSGIQHYKIYRNGAVVGTSASLAFADQDLTPNTSYTYVVTAVNGAGIEGPPSLPATATTLPDQTPPSAPSGLSATAVSSTQINLAWGAASDPESGIVSYRVYRGGVLIGSSATRTFSDAGLTPSTTYTYEVSAVNGAGLEGARAGPASATTQAPPVTGDLTVNVVSLGSNIPVGGYQAQVSASGVLRTQPVGSNASTTFSALAPQTYSVALQLPANCVVDDGANPRTVVVTGGASASTTFRVRCN